MPIYYVSSSGGNDSNDGLSEGQAWQTLARVFLVTFSPGDQILLRAGDVWYEVLTIKGAGTASEPIVVDSYGAGAKPILYGHIDPAAWAADANPGVYTFDTQQTQNMSRVFENVPASPVEYTLRQTTIGNETDWQNFLAALQPGEWGPTRFAYSRYAVRTVDGNTPAVNNLRAFTTQIINGIRMGKSYHIYRNLDMREGQHALNQASLVGINFELCDIQDILDLGFYYRQNCNSCVVDGCTTTRTGSDGVYFRQSTNMTCRNSTVVSIENPVLGIPTAGDQAGIGLETCVNSLVENNEFISVISNYIDTFEDIGAIIRYNYCHDQKPRDPTIAIGLHGEGMVCMHNIVFPLDQGISCARWNETGAKHVVAHNVVVGSDRNSLLGNKTRFYNNILLGDGYRGWAIDFKSEAESNNNCYWNLQPGTPTYRWDNVEYNTFEEWRTASGQDAASFEADPVLVNPAPSTPPDVKIQEASPCKDSGIDLLRNSIIPVNYPYVDWEGNSIPQGAGVDMGAYELAASNGGGSSEDFRSMISSGLSPNSLTAFNVPLTGFGVPKSAFHFYNQSVGSLLEVDGSIHNAGMVSTGLLQKCHTCRVQNGLASTSTNTEARATLAAMIRASAGFAIWRITELTAIAEDLLTYTNTSVDRAEDMPLHTIAFAGDKLQTAVADFLPNSTQIGNTFAINLGFEADLLILVSSSNQNNFSGRAWYSPGYGVAVNGSTIKNFGVHSYVQQNVSGDVKQLRASATQCVATPGNGQLGAITAFSATDATYTIQGLTGAGDDNYTLVLGFKLDGLACDAQMFQTPTTPGDVKYAFPFKADCGFLFSSSANVLDQDLSASNFAASLGMGVFSGLTQMGRQTHHQPGAASVQCSTTFSDSSILRISHRESTAIVDDVVGQITAIDNSGITITYSVVSPTPRYCILAAMEQPSEGPPPIPPVQPGIGGTSRRRRLRRRRLV